jgi:hypothetical protein
MSVAGCPPLGTFPPGTSIEHIRKALSDHTEECRNLHMYGHPEGKINIVVEGGKKMMRKSRKNKKNKKKKSRKSKKY